MIENFALLRHLNPDNVTHDDVCGPDIRTCDFFDPPVPPVTIDNVGSCSLIANDP